MLLFSSEKDLTGHLAGEIVGALTAALRVRNLFQTTMTILAKAFLCELQGKNRSAPLMSETLQNRDTCLLNEMVSNCQYFLKTPFLKHLNNEIHA